jgi:hypothetical protein
MDHNISAAGQWLAAEIKATNGHSLYVPGLVAHVARFEHPLLGSKALFDWWKAERVPTMHPTDFVPYDHKTDRLSRLKPCTSFGIQGTIALHRAGPTTTIHLGAAQRLLQFIRNHHESLDVQSEYLRRMTYREGCDALEKCLPKSNDPTTPLPVILAYVIQCFAGVAFDQRVKGVEERTR